MSDDARTPVTLKEAEAEAERILKPKPNGLVSGVQISEAFRLSHRQWVTGMQCMLSRPLSCIPHL